MASLECFVFDRIELMPKRGCSIEEVVTEAKELARRGGRSRFACVRFLFGDVDVSVSSQSVTDAIVRDYHRAQKGCIGRVIGPDSPCVLTDSEKSRDARLIALAQRLEGAPLVDVKPGSHERWLSRGSLDDPGSDLAFAVRWARLMQLEMEEGSELARVIEPTFNEALPTTSSAEEFAVYLMRNHWRHSGEFTSWWNYHTTRSAVS